MLFLMIGTYLGDLDDELLRAHIEWLVPKFEDGVFLISGGLDAVDDRPASATAILRADSREHALDILSTEPFFRAGLIDHDVTPFDPRVLLSDLNRGFDVPDVIRTIETRLAAVAWTHQLSWSAECGLAGFVATDDNPVARLRVEDS
jgi:uncharacterized protein YciI